MQVDVAGDEMPEPGDPEQERGVEDVGADDLGDRERKTITMTRPKNVPLPTEVSPTTKPQVAPSADRDHPVTVREQEGRVVRLHAACG